MGIQVQELTRNLMPWGKEYIDFSFAGRHISEFGLVAVTSGDRYQFAGSPEFEDETSNVNGVWGQYYWGTNFKTKTYSYSLATDGITERQLEDFKYHFRPGNYGQFYEDAWFDRYCYVRVKTVIDFSFIPFQEEIEIAGTKFLSRIYKGECKLTFIQDRPFMHSFYQVLDTKISDLQTLTDNGKAAIRMMYNSNIPARDSWEKNIKCSTGSFFSLPAIKNDINETEDTSNIFKEEGFIPFYNPSTIQTEALLEFTLERKLTKIDKINWKPVYFNEIYNEISNKQNPYNSISISDSIFTDAFSTIKENTKYTNILKYTMPEVSNEVNKAILIAWNFYQKNIRGSLTELQEYLQEEIINTNVLRWSIKILQKIQQNQILYCPYNNGEAQDGIVIDDNLTLSEQEMIEQSIDQAIGEVIFYSGDYETEEYKDNLDIPGCFRSNKIIVYPYPVFNETIEVDWFGYFNIMMLMMFAECDLNEQKDITSKDVFKQFYPYTLKFSGEQGQVFVTYNYNYFSDDGLINSEIKLEENCSNIIIFGHLRLNGGNIIDIKTGKIKNYYILSFNRANNNPMIAKNIRLEYKYTYI